MSLQGKGAFCLLVEEVDAFGVERFAEVPRGDLLA